MIVSAAAGVVCCLLGAGTNGISISSGATSAPVTDPGGSCRVTISASVLACAIEWVKKQTEWIVGRTAVTVGATTSVSCILDLTSEK